MKKIKLKDKQAEEISDYVISKNQAYSHTIFNAGISDEIHILYKENQHVFLVCGNYTKQEFKKISSELTNKFGSYQAIFYKDGKYYFRYAFDKRNNLKDTKLIEKRRKSLKNYSNEEIQKIITLSQPELLYMNKIYSRNLKRKISYYQPPSDRLEQEIIKYTFKLVLFDYSHIPEGHFRPEDTNSEREYLWIEKEKII